MTAWGDTVPTGESSAYRIQAYRIDTVPESAQETIAVGDSVTGEALDGKGDEDHFYVALSMGQRIRVCVSDADLNLPPDRLHAGIFGPDRIMYAGASTNLTRNACIDYTAETTGRHRVVIGSGGGRVQVSEFVPYTLVLTPR